MTWVFGRTFWGEAGAGGCVHSQLCGALSRKNISNLGAFPGKISEKQKSCSNEVALSWRGPGLPQVLSPPEHTWGRPGKWEGERRLR